MGSYFSRMNPFSSSNKKDTKEKEESEDDKEKSKGTLSGEELMEKRLKEESSASETDTLTFAVSEVEEGNVPGFEENQTGTLYIPKKYGMEANSKETQLTKLLDYHFHSELLNNFDNHYRCEECRKTIDMQKVKRYILKSSRLYMPPPNLAICLKRFKSSTGYFNSFSKNNKEVQFPMELDMTKYCITTNSNEKVFYDLYAIMVHHGGMGGGHYIAYAKHYIKGQSQWFYFSDSSFRKVSERDVLNAQAFMLFYERR